MSEPPDVLHWVALHWQGLASALGGTGIVGGVLGFAAKRLKPDQQAYLDTIDNLNSALAEVHGVVGRPTSLEQDCSRCRIANVQRRAAGLEISAMFRGDTYLAFRDHLTRVDSALLALEDALHHEPHPGAGPVRIAGDAAGSALEQLVLLFRRRCQKRTSIILHGRKKLPPKD